VIDTNDEKLLPQRVFNEILNEGRLEVADEIVAPGFRLHSPTRPEPFEGPAGFKEFVSDLRRGFPDLEITIDQVIAEGNIVSIRSHVTGTHLGKYRGIPPTRRKIAQTQLHMFRVAAGQVQETWQEIDGLGIMQQLKIFPSGDPPTPLVRLVIGIQKLARIR
jgi:predicted ester cyclase